MSPDQAAHVAVDIPDTQVATRARDITHTYSPPALVNHCTRSYLFAASLAHLSGWTVDLETLYVAAMLHDLGLEVAFDSHALDFEVAGGHVAQVFAAGAGWPADRRQRVGDIIQAHMQDPEPHVDVEGYLLSAATALDIAGRRPERWPRAFLMTTVARYPRLDLAALFTHRFTEQARRKPGGARPLTAQRSGGPAARESTERVRRRR